MSQIDIYSPGADITGVATSAITGKRCLKISGNRSGGNIAVAPADAAGRIVGVARDDAASGELVAVAPQLPTWLARSVGKAAHG